MLTPASLQLGSSRDGEDVAREATSSPGFHDPDLLDVAREAPTVSASTVPLGIQMLVEEGFELCLGDISSAFLQGGDLRRPNCRVFAEPPPGMGLDDCLVEVVKYMIYHIIIRF